MGSERRTSGDATIGRQSPSGRTALPRVPLSLASPVTRLPRITAADVKGLRKLRLHTVRDLLLELPYDWESYGAPVPIAELPLAAHATALVTVVGIHAKRSRIQDISLTEAVVADDRGSTMKVVWPTDAPLGSTNARTRQVPLGTAELSATASERPPAP